MISVFSQESQESPESEEDERSGVPSVGGGGWRGGVLHSQVSLTTEGLLPPP